MPIIILSMLLIPSIIYTQATVNNDCCCNKEEPVVGPQEGCFGMILTEVVVDKTEDMITLSVSPDERPPYILKIGAEQESNTTGVFSLSWSDITPNLESLVLIDNINCKHIEKIRPCDSHGQDVNFEWLQSIEIGDFYNDSGSDNGYGDYTHLEFNLSNGQDYPITLTPGFPNESYAEYWRIWIDFNQDRDYDDPNELVYDSDTSVLGNVQDIIHLPPYCETFSTNMRISMRYIDTNDTIQMPCEEFIYGEVEDYIVTLTSRLAENIFINRFPDDAIEVIVFDNTPPYTLTADGYFDSNSSGYFYIPPQILSPHVMALEIGNGLGCSAIVEIPEATVPIELLSVKGYAQNCHNHLTWTTATETQSSHFEVQKSQNAKDFENIGRIEAAGQSNQPQQYNFVDKSPQKGITYYRIKQYNKDGSFDYFETLALRNDCKTESTAILKVYPNPATDDIWIDIMATASQVGQSYQLKLYNTLGQRIYEREINLKAGLQTIDVGIKELADGTYFVLIEDETWQSDKFSFVKQD